jgi:hypothetical protein
MTTEVAWPLEMGLPCEVDANPLVGSRFHEKHWRERGAH